MGGPRPLRPTRGRSGGQHSQSAPRRPDRNHSRLKKSQCSALSQAAVFCGCGTNCVEPHPGAPVFKKISAPTNERSTIAMLLPAAGFGNKVPLLVPERTDAWQCSANRVSHRRQPQRRHFRFRAAAEAARADEQPLQPLQHLQPFLPEQLPAIAPARFNDPLPAAFTQAMRAASLMNGHRADPTVVDVMILRGLALSYTAHGHGTVRA